MSTVSVGVGFTRELAAGAVLRLVKQTIEILLEN